MPYPHKAIRWTPVHAADEEVARDTLFIGVELELENREEATDRYTDPALMHMAEEFDKSNPALWNYGMDGSLHFGMEAKTHPFTQRYYEHGDMNLVPLFDYLRTHARPWEPQHREYTAGVHIHLCRAAFTAAHMERFLEFHYDNPKFFQMVAGREANNYASFDIDKDARSEYDYARNVHVGKDRKAHIKSLAEAKSRGSTRYMAVNMANTNTIELRYFVSTTKRLRFEGYIQWAFALYEYTKDAENVLTPAAFKSWLAIRPQYRQARMLSRGYLKVETPSEGVPGGKVQAFMPGGFQRAGLRRA